MVSFHVHYFLPTLIGCHGNDPGQIWKRGASGSSPCKAISYRKNIVKIGLVYPEILDCIREFLPFCTKSSQMSFVNSGVRTKVHKIFTRYRLEVSQTLLMRTLMLWYSIPFRNARATNDGRLQFFHKIGCHGNVPWEKKVQIDHLHSKRFHMAKILWKSVRRFWDNCSPSDQ